MPSASRIDWYSIGFLCLGSAARIAFLPFESDEAADGVIPWYNSLAHGGFAMLATDFSNYNPPYLYLLWLASLVFGPDQALLAIKCIGIAADIGLCVAVALLVRRCSYPATPLLRPFAVLWCVPTVVLNSSVWSQCDALYAAFVVGALVATYSRPVLAFSLFGIAASIKLQAVLAAPAFGLLLLKGRVPWKSLAAAPLTWLTLLVPAALAGRHWGDLLTIYARQAGAYQQLSLNAPNLWWVVGHFSWSHGQGYLVTLGLLAALVGGIAYVRLGSERLANDDRCEICELAFVAAFIFPFLLPKMHDRYFFLADVLSVALALADRRWVPIAVLVQIASLAAYAPFLLHVNRTLPIGVLCNALVFAVLVLRWYPRAERLVPGLALRALTGIAAPLLTVAEKSGAEPRKRGIHG